MSRHPLHYAHFNTELYSQPDSSHHPLCSSCAAQAGQKIGTSETLVYIVTKQSCHHGRHLHLSQGDFLQPLFEGEKACKSAE